MKTIPTTIFDPALIPRTERTQGASLPGRLRLPSSLRTRLILIVVVIDCLAALLSGSAIVWKARTATKLEIVAAMQVAQTLVADTIRLMQDSPTPVLLRSIDLHFQSVRHVRISVFDEDGAPVEAAVSRSPLSPSDVSPPAWFARLVSPPIETKDFPIVVRHRNIGLVTITSEPADEVGEAWVYAHAILLTAAGLNVLVLAALFLAFGRVLAPLKELTAGLKNLETKNYDVRLPHSSLAELATITAHFNQTAEALAAANDANRQLTRQLVTAQDDERRRTALELHDEAGPCLFALEATARSIGTMTESAPDLARVHARALETVKLVETVQGINRRVLDRLRPMALGHIPLRESLVNLLVGLDSGNGPRLVHDIGTLRESYDALVDLTIYRCAQEGLFNAVRHAGASRIALAVSEQTSGDELRVHVQVTDDGRGLGQPKRVGYGVAGMRERVEALSGTFEMTSSDAGTRLSIAIPAETTTAQPSKKPKLP